MQASIEDTVDAASSRPEFANVVSYLVDSSRATELPAPSVTGTGTSVLTVKGCSRS
jgi:hypothetical protein